MDSQLVVAESSLANVSRIPNLTASRDKRNPVEKFNKKQFLEDKRECGRLIIASKLSNEYTDQLAQATKKKQQDVGNRLLEAQKQFKEFEDSLATKSERIQLAEREAERLSQQRLSLEDEVSRLNLEDSLMKSDIVHLVRALEAKQSLLHFFDVSNPDHLSVTDWSEILTSHMTNLSEAVLFLIKDTEDNRATIEAGERRLRLASHLNTFKSGITVTQKALAPLEDFTVQNERDKLEIVRLEKSIESTRSKILHVAEGVAKLYGICNSQSETVSAESLVEGQLICIEAYAATFADFCAQVAESGHSEDLRKLEVKLDQSNRARHRKMLIAEQEAKTRQKLEKIIRDVAR